MVLAALFPSNLDAHEATPTRPPRNSQVGFAKSPRLKLKPSRMNYAGLSRAKVDLVSIFKTSPVCVFMFPGVCSEETEFSEFLPSGQSVFQVPCWVRPLLALHQKSIG